MAALAAALAILVGPATAVSAAPSSLTYPNVRDAASAGAVVDIGSFSSHGDSELYGMIGLGIVMGGGASPSQYWPCDTTATPDSAGCKIPPYYRCFGLAPDHSPDPRCGTAWAGGMAISNLENSGAANPDNFGAKVTGAILEVYPHRKKVSDQSDGGDSYNSQWGAYTVFGGIRIELPRPDRPPADAFPNPSASGYRSDPIGNISLPQEGDPHVGILHGYVLDHGVKVTDQSVNITMDGWTTSTNFSSTGYPVKSFTSHRSYGDGYWTSGPFISGDSQLDVTWNGTGVHCTNAYVPVGQEGWLPINLDQPLFGLGNNPNWGCTQGAASPSPPTQVAAIWSGAGQATITWGAPASDGGSPITGYQVALDNSAFPSPQGAFVWTGLRGGRSYTFGVRAVNAVGVSDWVTATVAIIRMKAAWVP